jgi:hypothetical protein
VAALLLPYTGIFDAAIVRSNTSWVAHVASMTANGFLASTATASAAARFRRRRSR